VRGPEIFTTITPADATLLSGYQWLRIGGAGDLVVQGPWQSAPETIPVEAGEYVPFGSGYVMAATTATGIKGFG
jgi:hypothetical protein